ncbi:hypothetical protein BN11_1600007 [Nostocoides australiense Ben110]|uniref:Uncharacterized protein n=1 Tax=Nostocoides australiense Ben110 TaxID=1193182 RepID=W6JU08_9MICO|nr:hypothetical protein BN11_1600007 [Tetrasphaera australiensis Ben110]
MTHSPAKKVAPQHNRVAPGLELVYDKQISRHRRREAQTAGTTGEVRSPPETGYVEMTGGLSR